MCDARDGVTDGLIENPVTCKFDPKALECSSGDAPSCLTPAQVEAARTIYAPAVNPRTRQEIYPAMQPGSELGWGGLAGPQPAGEAVELFKYLVFSDERWDFRTLAFDTAVALTDKADGGVLNATDAEPEAVLRSRRQAAALPRLERSAGCSGEHHQLLQPRARRRPAARHGCRAVRLFMMPGMTHCAGGEGPTRSTKSPSWKSGSSADRRRIESLRHTALTEKSIARARSVPIRRWRPTKEQAASTKRRVSCVKRLKYFLLRCRRVVRLKADATGYSKADATGTIYGPASLSVV